MFPEKDFIVRIYEAMCNYLQVAEGFGINSVHDFDLNLFCKTFKFPILPAYHALKILEQSGYIEYIEEADSQSRVMVTVHRDELNKLKTRAAMKEKEEICELLSSVNPSLTTEWEKIKQ